MFWSKDSFNNRNDVKTLSGYVAKPISATDRKIHISRESS